MLDRWFHASRSSRRDHKGVGIRQRGAPTAVQARGPRRGCTCVCATRVLSVGAVCARVPVVRHSTAAVQPRTPRARVPARTCAVEEAKRKAATPDRVRKRERELAALERGLTADRSVLMGMSFRVTALLGVANFALWWVLSSYFAGVVMARLPFAPVAFFSAMMHRGLPGSDLRECNFLGVFALTNMLLRPIVARAFGNKAGAAGMPGMGAAGAGGDDAWSQLFGAAAKHAGQ